MADQNITALPVATSPASSDQLLLVGATEEKLIDYDKLADAILTKLTSKQYTLDQGTKTLPAALNELNSKAVGAFKAVGFADRSTITIKTNSSYSSYGILIVAINQNGNNGLLKFNITPSVNQIIDEVSVIAKDSTTIIVTFPSTYTHGVIIAGGTISKATFTVS